MKNQVARTPSPPSADVQSVDSNEQLLDRHLGAFLQNDLEAVVSDYAEDATLVAPWGIYAGPKEIQGFFRELMKDFPKGASTLTLDHKTFEADLVYFTWHGATPTVDVPFATDTMIVRDGRIVKQTFAGVLRPLKP
jgi:hypothetical protein